MGGFKFRYIIGALVLFNPALEPGVHCREDFFALRRVKEIPLEREGPFYLTIDLEKAREFLARHLELKEIQKFKSSELRKAIQFLELNRSTLENEKLSFLMQVLYVAEKIPAGQLYPWALTAHGRDIYLHNQELIDSLVPKKFGRTKVRQALAVLEELRPQIRDLDGSRKRYSLSFLMVMLWTAEKIPEDELKNWQSIALYRDLYLANPLMQQVSAFSYFKGPAGPEDPSGALGFLLQNRDKFVPLSDQTEQELSLGYLIGALWAGGKTPLDQEILKAWSLLASAYELFLFSSPLQEAPQFGEDYQSGIDWAVEHKLKILGKKGEVLSLWYIIQSLWTADRIKYPEASLDQLWFYARAADYSIRRRAMLEDELLRAWRRMPEEMRFSPEAQERIVDFLPYNGDIRTTSFVRVDGKKRAISRRYFDQILLYALRYYGRDFIRQLQVHYQDWEEKIKSFLSQVGVDFDPAYLNFTPLTIRNNYIMSSLLGLTQPIPLMPTDMIVRRASWDDLEYSEAIGQDKLKQIKALFLRFSDLGGIRAFREWAEAQPYFDLEQGMAQARDIFEQLTYDKLQPAPIPWLLFSLFTYVSPGTPLHFALEELTLYDVEDINPVTIQEVARAWGIDQEFLQRVIYYYR